MMETPTGLCEISNTYHKNVSQIRYVLIYVNVGCFCNDFTGNFWNACAVKNVVNFRVLKTIGVKQLFPTSLNLIVKTFTKPSLTIGETRVFSRPYLGPSITKQ
jgi:hypothetical protein